MAATKHATDTGTTRGRGKRAGLNLAVILGAARKLAPDTLTMRAVAEALGVDRKALNHHVTDRETLLELLAADAFRTNTATVQIPADSSWQEACRVYATRFAESLIETGLLAASFRLGSSLAAGFVVPGEVLLQKLIAAGLDDETAARLLLLLANISISYARDSVTALQSERPMAKELQRVLQESTCPRLENTERILHNGVRIDASKQLELGIEVFVRGVEARISGARSSIPDDR